MTEVSERYRRLADAMADKIAAVPADRWTSPTPCDEWVARDLVRHVVSTQRMFLGFVGEELGDIPSVDDDPSGAWRAASSAVLAALEDPERASTAFEGFSGPTTFEAAVNRFLCFDLVVHGWDLARAAGLDERIEPQDVARVQGHAEEFGDKLRSPQAFGAARDVPPGSDDQTRLLAFLGRTP